MTATTAGPTLVVTTLVAVCEMMTTGRTTVRSIEALATITARTPAMPQLTLVALEGAWITLRMYPGVASVLKGGQGTNVELGKASATASVKDAEVLQLATVWYVSRMRTGLTVNAFVCLGGTLRTAVAKSSNAMYRVNHVTRSNKTTAYPVMMALR